MDGLATHATLNDLETVGSPHACLLCEAGPLSKLRFTFFRTMHVRLQGALEQRQSMGSSAPIRTTRARNNFPGGAGVATPFPLHVAGKQIQRIDFIGSGEGESLMWAAIRNVARWGAGNNRGRIFLAIQGSVPTLATGNRIALDRMMSELRQWANEIVRPRASCN